MARYDIDRIDNRDDALIQRLAPWAERLIGGYHRAQVRGVERVPPGPALFVGNHSAGMWTPDSYTLCVALLRAHGMSAVPYGLAHEKVVSVGWVNRLIVPLGAVRASHQNAMRLFDRGDKVLVYPGGDVDSIRPWTRRNEVVFGGRRGYIKLALEAGVPIIPVVTAGSHSSFVVLNEGRWTARVTGAERWFRLKVMPVTLAAPWGIQLVPGPYIPFPAPYITEILPPIRLDRGHEAVGDVEYLHAQATEVEGQIQRTLTRLADELRTRRNRR
jgi:1-acyl-sn-glycerol-3-phosphate acyltransferase